MDLRESESIKCSSCKVNIVSYKCVKESGSLICCRCWLINNGVPVKNKVTHFKNKVDRLRNKVDRPIKRPNIGGYVWK